MIYINTFSLINALGATPAEISSNLARSLSGLQKTEIASANEKSQTYTGTITADLPVIPEQYPQHRSRNNQLLLHCLNEIEKTLSLLSADIPSHRIAIIMGTSTSGIAEGESAASLDLQNERDPKFHYQQQCFSDPSDFLAAYLNVSGPSYTISTACSSSARAFISAANLIETGLIDLAIVGGADTLCQLSLQGFHALGALSKEPCQPFAKNRSGINIGEAAGLMILSKKPSNIALLGWGSSSDAWHISAPHPEGIGAEASMRQALKKADLKPEEIGYVNLHGTGTALNDSAESKAIYNIFKDSVPCSSTKYLTGHTLGAAGITEIGLSALILEKKLSLPHQPFSASYLKDTELAPIQFAKMADNLKYPYILSNSFAFGGNNASLIIGAPDV